MENIRIKSNLRRMKVYILTWQDEVGKKRRDRMKNVMIKPGRNLVPGKFFNILKMNKDYKKMIEEGSFEILEKVGNSPKKPNKSKKDNDDDLEI